LGRFFADDDEDIFEEKIDRLSSSSAIEASGVGHIKLFLFANKAAKE
jgi:hypothetical protein